MFSIDLEKENTPHRIVESVSCTSLSATGRMVVLEGSKRNLFAVGFQDMNSSLVIGLEWKQTEKAARTTASCRAMSKNPRRPIS